MKRFRLSPEAADDINEIWRFIAEHNIDAAERVRAELLNACRLLTGNPGLGHRRLDLTQRAVRFWPVFSYVIIYRENSKPLEVVRVVHAARDVGRLL
ncbi:MAG: type II toxin-antitoxin system RelE/ParE family toxin [Bryobacterales bacterium]